MIYNNFFIKFLYITYILSILLLFEHTNYFKIITSDNYINFDYFNYQNDIITKKIINESDWLLSLDEAYLINGLIRKHRPKNCLEIGVANGGSSILILNAIKDFPESSLVSIDLFTFRNNKKIGYKVEENFPELMMKWKLFLGDMPHKFLSRLNIKFDLVFLDSAHIIPGEFFNFIEVLPFLNDNAIIILHDIVWHFYRLLDDKVAINKETHPTQINLMSSLIGNKIMFKSNKKYLMNIGAVFLDKNQKKYYLNYFLLLMNFWNYLPTDKQLNELRKFIIKYYNDKILLKIYDKAIYFNKKVYNRLNNKVVNLLNYT